MNNEAKLLYVCMRQQQKHPLPVRSNTYLNDIERSMALIHDELHHPTSNM